MFRARLPRLERGTYGLEEPYLKYYCLYITISYTLANCLSCVCRWAIYQRAFLEFPPKSPPNLRQSKNNKKIKLKSHEKLSWRGVSVAVCFPQSRPKRKGCKGGLCLL